MREIKSEERVVFGSVYYSFGTWERTGRVTYGVPWLVQC